MTDSVRSAQEVLTELRAQHPDTPFLALGQTVFWDEPVKASIRLLLDSYGLGGDMVIGVHDTDYFAKAKLRHAGKSRFLLTPHNDGSTKDLWSAAGEISTLFGSETFPTRDHYAKAGVAFERASKISGEEFSAFLDKMTEAWGWRGVVYTGSRDLVVNSLSVQEVGDSVLEMLAWGFENAIAQIAPDCCQREARRVADAILEWCKECRDEDPAASLSDLFQCVLPQIYQMLLGRKPAQTVVTCTTDLLRLAPDTASLPRFRLVDAFLNPATREIAINAYNQAVAGSEIYTLDKFGAGALPFDVIVPGRGRGTLRIHPKVLFIETRQPIPIGLKKPITSIQELAEVLHAKFKEPVTLVGKAVSLVSMLSQEFLFLFHEEGSMYVWRTKKMNDILRAAGIDLNFHPIVRIRYQTWDALAEAQSTLRLPEHLASAFGRATITAPEFATSWKSVVEEQKAFCERSAALQKPLELLAYLQTRESVAGWDERTIAYLEAKTALLGLVERRNAIQEEVRETYDKLRVLRAERLAVQQRKGNHFRSVKDWTSAENAVRAAFEEQEESLAQEKSRLHLKILRLRNERLHCERGEEAQRARGVMQHIENEAELARLRLVRNALLTVEGLPHTAHRPSAWWFPMADKTGQWFQRVAETAELYLQPLQS